MILSSIPSSNSQKNASAAKKIKEEHSKHSSWNSDVGFRIFKLDASNIKAWNPKSSKKVNNLEYFQRGTKTHPY